MIVAGTGHRPNKVGGYSQEASSKLYYLAKDWLAVNKPDKVISGMALGWDQALANAAYVLDIPFVAAVPFAGQQQAWPEESRQFFDFLLGAAEEIVIVSDGGYAPWKMQVRNEWMVDHCDTVLALWDGNNGGTGNCIKYANKVGKPIVNLWEIYDQVR
jgi:uncharacterized phage-like protein YoqJ